MGRRDQRSEKVIVLVPKIEGLVEYKVLIVTSRSIGEVPRKGFFFLFFFSFKLGRSTESTHIYIHTHEEENSDINV